MDIKDWKCTFSIIIMNICCISAPNLSIFIWMRRLLRLYLDRKGRFRQNKKTRPRKFYFLSNKTILVKIGPRFAEWSLTDGIPVKVGVLLNISATMGRRKKWVTSFERAPDVPLGRVMKKYFGATARHPFPGIAEMTVCRPIHKPMTGDRVRQL